MSIDKSKAALESCSGWAVNGTTDMALLAIANALVAIAEQGVESTLECIEDKSRWAQMFGTPERAARTFTKVCEECRATFKCRECPLYPIVGDNARESEFLEWLRGASNGE